ncbi:MAG: bifunctional adenosylcobinamide kinase/adenosylcobinamide-phosphate guanylyltransferase [Nitrospiraceae bacterium]|nr:MAG: bifunctional adenosylcobinamide kinase/adenosylcobinamide-phosphate guanylyltransferase [Nitrospiraceae bacterium]UCH45040.1 MAG: bifunctional adenosylcobinamide kinase/adenosylcobinamide-phosphate guanylyltransferase [Nitrospiraceae bacterium]
MSAKITFVIGGARSGKSSFVLNKAAETRGPRAYIATGEALDAEMQDRIQQHREDRGTEWVTCEEPVRLAETVLNSHGKYTVIVIDCLTLWLSNIMTRTQNTDQRTKTTDSRQEMIYENMNEFVHTLNQMKNSSDSSLKSGFCNLYIVSNEVGMGIVPENPLAREFRDLAGFLNQKVAEAADEVYMVAAGIPVKIK